MIGLRKKLQSLRGSLSRLNTKLNDAIDEFMDSPVEDVDLSTLQDSFDVQLESGTRVGLNIAAIQEEINLVKDNIKEIRPAWKVSNLKPFVFVQEGIYRYFPSKQAKYVIESRQTTHNPVLRFIEQWRAGAFSGDFSPFAIQGLIGVQADPIGSLKAFAGGLSKGIRNRDFLHSVTVEGLMDDIASDPESFAEFSSMMGRRLTGTPAEYAAGFLSKIPGFDKFTETTYVTVTRGSWNLWKRNWKRLVESGVPEIEAKVAAIEMTRKVYPLVAPAKLGQSQKRHALLRALPTSYSFIRQPATLMAQASMGYAKFITGQTLSIQERLAVRHMTTLAGSVVATSVTSAIVSAIAMGKDDDEIWQAALDAVNPDPFNGKFLSLIIGEFRIPLGGPYRSIFRAIYPQPVKGIPFPVPFAGIPRFIVNRITPALKTQINLLLNRDYFGKQLIKGEFPENLIRGILYELEGAVPLSIGETIGGIRREEATEDIARQAAAQFVGVNLIQLDNTYFHRVVLEMGTEKEDQLLYSKDRQVNTSKDLWGNVGRAISSLTVEEVKQRKGYPPQIAIIAEIRDLKKNVVDVLPNSKLKDIDFEMLSNRQDLLADEEKLAEFDKKYPYYSSVSLRQFDLLRSYHSANEEKQAEMIEKYPELTEIPRQEYLRSHPFENAQLAVWGQADILTREAYTEFKRLIKEYDIPDSAIPVVVIPPEESVDTHFDYMDAVSEYGGGSLEADVVLAKDDTYREWRGLQPPTSSVESLELKIANKGIEPDVPEYKDNQRKIQAYDNNGEEFVDKWVERGKIVDEFSAGSSEAKLWLLDNPDVHNWALDSGLLTDDGSDWNRESLELNVELRDLTEDSEEYTKLDTRRQAINEGFTNLDEIAEYSDLPAAGFRRARYLTEHTELAGEMSAIRGVEIPEYIPPEEYDELKEKDTLTPEEEHKVRAYEKKVPLEHIDNYVAYYSLERPEGVERWYEDDWFLMENADYYQNVYLGILGNQRADFRNVPTRAVYSKWIRYNDLPYGKARDQFRLDNKDLDEWGVNAGIWAMTMTEQRKKQDKTVGEKFIESIKGITALK